MYTITLEEVSKWLRTRMWWSQQTGLIQEQQRNIDSEISILVFRYILTKLFQPFSFKPELKQIRSANALSLWSSHKKKIFFKHQLFFYHITAPTVQTYDKEFQQTWVSTLRASKTGKRWWRGSSKEFNSSSIKYCTARRSLWIFTKWNEEWRKEYKNMAVKGQSF